MLSFHVVIDIVMLCWILVLCVVVSHMRQMRLLQWLSSYAINVRMDVDEESKGMLHGCVWVCISVRRGFNFLNETFLEEHYVY